MKVDFHYCAIRVLAEKAGFSPEEAQRIAVASQYTDDAVEHKPIHIQGVPEEAKRCLTNGVFDPVCTAHAGLRYLTFKEKKSQRTVYIPFHFLPGQTYGGKGKYEYRTLADSPLARSLVGEAVKTLTAAKDDGVRRAALIKLGIALHTYADTWAHQGFSGRHSSKDNDICKLAIRENGNWNELGLFEQLIHNIAPDIGHAEAVEFPDTAHLVWRFTRESDGKTTECHNPERYLQAAEAIYHLLRSLTGAPSDWDNLRVSLEACFSLANEKPFKTWKAAFGLAPFKYDKLAFRKASLSGGSVEWDHFQLADDFAKLKLRATANPDWFLFHAAAKTQREWVREHIRKDLA